MGRRLKEEQSRSVDLKNDLENITIEIHQQRFELLMDHRITTKDSLSVLTADEHIEDDDVEVIVLSQELDQIQSELEFFHQKYGWNIDLKQERAQPKVESNDESNIEMDMVPTNNAEEHELNGVDEEEKNESNPIIKRTKEEIVAEIEKVKQDISATEAQKDQLQSDINDAVANEQYEEAGRLAPQKKKLIAKVKELKARLDELEQEIIKRTEEEHVDECVLEDVDDATQIDKSAENIDPNKEINDATTHEMNGIIQNNDDSEQNAPKDVDVSDEQTASKIEEEDADSDDDTNMFA